MEPSAATANSPVNSGLRQTMIHTESPGVSTPPPFDESGACPWSMPGRLPPMSREANTRAGLLMSAVIFLIEQEIGRASCRERGVMGGWEGVDDKTSARKTGVG